MSPESRTVVEFFLGAEDRIDEHLDDLEVFWPEAAFALDGVLAKIVRGEVDETSPLLHLTLGELTARAA